MIGHRASCRGIGLALLWALGCGEPPVPDIVIVTWDTVRWDHTGPGPDGAPSATPTFDRLAETGVRFAEARAPTAITLPSHATPLTGLFPASHGARDNGVHVVRDDAPRLAARLRERGYHTAAFVSAAVLAARAGLAEGFDHYDEAPVEHGRFGAVAERRGDATVDAAIAWLAEPPVEPLFLWVHLYDPHRSWSAPAPFAARHSPYRAEIAFADAQTDRLLDALEERGRLERTLRVPLLFWTGAALGGDWERGAEIPGPASLADVTPTLAELAGLPELALDGRSLAESLAGAPVPARRLPVESVVPDLDFGTRPVFG